MLYCIKRKNDFSKLIQKKKKEKSSSYHFALGDMLSCKKVEETPD